MKKKSNSFYPYIGCHISIAGGIEKAPQRAAEIGAEIMQIFSRSPQGGKKREINSEIANKFKRNVIKYNIRDTYIHSPYYINFASSNNRIRYGSLKTIQEELAIANSLKIKYVITHLGSTKDLGEKKGIKKTIEMLQKTLKNYKGKAQLLLENTAGSGSIIGDRFSELNYILEKVNHSALGGICLDTQHSFASGYNWKDWKKTLSKIKQEVELNKIKVIHANDSLSDCGSHIDRHAHIGEGKIGKKAFQNIVRFAHKQKINMILETRYDKIKQDIELLKKMRSHLKK